MMKIHSLSLLLAGFLTLIISGAGCQKLENQARSHDRRYPIQVLTTTNILADVVQRIGGERLQVESLMGPGVDPHLYKARPSDAQKLQKADLIVINGLHLEGQIDTLLRQQTDRVLAAGDDLPNLRDADPGASGHYDPHIWFDISLWKRVVERIRDRLCELDPAHAEEYRNRAQLYNSELHNLDQEIRREVAKIPASKRILITCHDAFGYFGRAYGFQVYGLQGVSTASDASGKDVRELADVIGKNRIPSIFAETSVPDKGLKAVLKAVESQYGGHRCRLADTQLFSDSLGEPDTEAGTYLGMFRSNLKSIVQALGEE